MRSAPFRPALENIAHTPICDAARAVAEALPNGSRCSLVDQTHHIVPDATAPALEDFLAS